MTDKDTIKKFSIWTIVGGLGVVLGIIIAIFALEDRVEKIVLDKLKDPEVLKEIAYYLRPSLTFDHNGTIISDSGARKFIKDIKVVMGKNEPEAIVLSPSEHLNTAPILECLNYNFSYSTKRVSTSDWQYSLSSPNYVTWQGPGIKEWIFRIEIIR